MKLLLLVSLLVSSAIGQTTDPLILTQQACIYGPLTIANPSNPGQAAILPTSESKICTPMPGAYFWIVQFGGGIFAVNEFGLIVNMITWNDHSKPVIEEFNYGVH